MAQKKLSKTAIKKRLKQQKEADQYHFGDDPSQKKETDDEKRQKFIEEQSAGDSRRTLNQRNLSK